MDANNVMEEGYWNICGEVGAQIKEPNYSLRMGNQARVSAEATVITTSTRESPNRFGEGENLSIGSAELSAVSGIMGHLPHICGIS